MSRENKLIKNTFIVAIGKICTQFLSFFLLPLYTAYLSTSEFGLVDLLNTIISLLLPIIILQIDQGLFRFLIDARNDDKNKKSIISSSIFFVFFSLIIYIFLFICIGSFWKNDFKVFLVTNVIVTIFSSVFLQISRGLGKNKVYSKGSVITALSTIFFNIIFIVIFDLGAYGMFISSFVANLVCIIYISIKLAIYKYISIKYFDEKVLKEILKYSLPLVPNMLSWWIVNASDRTIIAFFLGTSFNGIYSISNKFSNICISFFNIFNMTWSESAATYINDLDSSQYISKIINKAFIFSSSICVCLIGLIPFVFNILIDSKYSLAFYQIPILILATIFNILSALIGSIYVAKKESSKIAKTSILAAGINIIVNLLLIKSIGLYAASISTFLSFLAMAIYRYFDVQKHVRLRFNKKSLLCLFFIIILSLLSYYNNVIILKVIVLPTIFIISYMLNLELIHEIFNRIKMKMVKKYEKN